MQHARPALILIGLACLGIAANAQAASNCTLKLKGDDKMQFDLKTRPCPPAAPRSPSS
jgi:azurin